MPPRTVPDEALGVAAEPLTGQAQSQNCNERLEISIALGPIEPREATTILEALARLTQGASWSRIQPALLASQATVRSHLIVHRLVAAAANQASCTAQAKQADTIDVRFLASGIRPIRELEETLRMLRTPFSMTVTSTDPDSGRLRACWDLGWDEPTVLILGETPRDRHARSELWECMEQLVGG